MQRKWRIRAAAGAAVLIIVAGAVVLTRHAGNSPATAGTQHSTTVNGAGSGSSRQAPSGESSSSKLVSGSGADIITIRSSATLGHYLADGAGRALYMYGQDKPDESHCSGACSGNWPPYTTAHLGSLPVHVSDIKRADGRIQYTYNGLPLYYFANEKPDVVTGNGVSGFHIAKP